MKITEQRINEATESVAVESYMKELTSTFKSNDSRSEEEIYCFLEDVRNSTKLMSFLNNRPYDFSSDVDYELAIEIISILNSLESHVCYGVPLSKIALIHWLLYTLYDIARNARMYFKESYKRKSFDTICSDILKIEL